MEHIAVAPRNVLDLLTECRLKHGHASHQRSGGNPPLKNEMGSGLHYCI